jgi:predicted nucleic-acid-binding protein
MIALDTNVLVRFLVEDDVSQARRAKRFIRKQVQSDSPCFVSDIVMCEVVWVLQSSYKVRRPEILRVLEQLLRARHMSFEAVDRLSRALRAFAAGRGDFADYLIREQSLGAGCEAVVTFDEVLTADPGFIPFP